MKPLEFKIEEVKGDEILIGYNFVFYYENGDIEKIAVMEKPNGLELNKHYSITDVYGYEVGVKNE